jgi:acetaldehyde/propanal dehydrogenase
VVGIDANSDGLRRARELGVKTTHEGVDGILAHLKKDNIQIAFDATSAHSHHENAKKLQANGVLTIDLTPAAIGPYCVPPVNLQAHVGTREMNVNMVTCGGQATIPMVAAVSRVQPVAYAEIVATVASKSIGPGTRQNIDEFTRTTAGAVEKVAARRRARPSSSSTRPSRRSSCATPSTARPRPRPREAHHRVGARDDRRGAEYVPGYTLKNGPWFDGNRVTVFMEVEGLGDYLPKYAGNLDIMTAAALRTAEMFAEEIRRGTMVLKATSEGSASSWI